MPFKQGSSQSSSLESAEIIWDDSEWSFRLEKQPETDLHPHFYNISTVKMLIKNVVKMLLGVGVGVNKFPLLSSATWF